MEIEFAESEQGIRKRHGCAHSYTLFLLNADGTKRYASFLSILVMYRVAIFSPQFGQKITPWYCEKSIEPSIMQSLYNFTKPLYAELF